MSRVKMWVTDFCQTVGPYSLTGNTYEKLWLKSSQSLNWLFIWYLRTQNSKADHWKDKKWNFVKSDRKSFWEQLGEMLCWLHKGYSSVTNENLQSNVSKSAIR